MASPHPGMHVLCPVCEGPIPDLLGELTDDPAGINAGTGATDCYYCGAPLLCPGLGSLIVASSSCPSDNEESSGIPGCFSRLMERRSQGQRLSK